MTDPPATPPPLTEGVDYVVEAGRWVFLRPYLLRRGTCCGNGCRHCPYGRPGGVGDGDVANASEDPKTRVGPPAES